MRRAETQKEEIATIRKRTITLELSDADCDRISRKAGENGLTVAELLQNFIGDLVDGTYSNGSDERRLAEEWFDRCWFAYQSDNTLLQYLINESCGDDTLVSDLIECCDVVNREIEHFKEYGEYDDEDDLDYFKEKYQSIISDWIKDHPDADLEKEVAACRVWRDELSSIKK